MNGANFHFYPLILHYFLFLIHNRYALAKHQYHQVIQDLLEKRLKSRFFKDKFFWKAIFCEFQRFLIMDKIKCYFNDYLNDKNDRIEVVKEFWKNLNVWKVIIGFIIIKAILISICFFKNFGLYGGFASTLCNLNCVIIFLYCLRSRQLQLYKYNYLKNENKRLRKCIENYKSLDMNRNCSRYEVMSN
jgi:hypothetical protein